MSDPGANQERYCSSYYDKHGLYNDGFPCPADKYCCQTADGTKMCCPLNQNLDKENLYSNDNYFNKLSNNIMPAHQAHHLSTPSHILTTISSINLIDFNRQKSINKQHTHQDSNTLVSTSSSSLSSNFTFLISNSSLMISVCIALTILVVLATIFLVCMCRCLIKKLKQSKSSNHHHLKVKKNLDRKNSTAYSRNSSSSCSSTTGTSSTSTSPKANQLTICCDEDMVEEHQKILSRDPSQASSSLHHHSHLRQMTPLTNSEVMQKSLMNPNLASLLAHNTFMMSQNQNGTIPKSGLLSSGSSNVALLHSHLNSANTTQTSFVTNSNQHAEMNQNFADLADFVMNEEDDEADFIVSTSSNLEFLKTHSLFNSTPLNYYPSLTAANKNQKPLIEEPPTYSDSQMSQPAQIQTSNQLNTNNVVDFRFSTFLPPIYANNKPNNNNTNDLI